LLVTVAVYRSRIVGVDTDCSVYSLVPVGKVYGLLGTGEINTDGEYSSNTIPGRFSYHLIAIVVVIGHIEMAMGVYS
jgi:hypothetical protein